MPEQYTIGQCADAAINEQMEQRHRDMMNWLIGELVGAQENIVELEAQKAFLNGDLSVLAGMTNRIAELEKQQREVLMPDALKDDVQKFAGHYYSVFDDVRPDITIGG